MDLEKYLPGAASIGEHLDTRLLVTMRDGRNFLGTLRSFDQFMNLVLENTIERVIYEDCYCDLPLGVFLVRGDNIIIFGEVDADKERNISLKPVSQEELQERIASSEANNKDNEWELE